VYLVSRCTPPRLILLSMLDKNLNTDPSDALKAAFRRHASGVAIITTKTQEGAPIGFTATSMTSLGSNPALVTFNVARGSSSWPTLSTATHLALHMLGSKNLELAKKLAADHTQRFVDDDWEFSEFGLPVFKEVTAVLFVKVREYHAIEQNAVFITEVLSGTLGSEDKALLYNQRAYFSPADTAL
jgi:flavin reductase (DIM6/NTAB) family NADH-FMN oxidoreductase RutF